MFSTRSDAPPTQNGQKTDLRVRWKMVKNAHLLPFSISGPSGACTMPQLFSTESSYSIGNFWWKNFFSTHLPKKNFCAWKFSKISLEKNFDQRNRGYEGARARRVFAHKTPSYTSSNHQNIALIWQASQKDDFYHYFFLWETDLKVIISLNKPQMFDITVALRPIW